MKATVDTAKLVASNDRLRQPEREVGCRHKTTRFFTWVIKDKLAVCERPGGYPRNHRKVRRREEILWIKCQGFTRVVSLLASPHNLHAYDEEKPCVVSHTLRQERRPWFSPAGTLRAAAGVAAGRPARRGAPGGSR